MTTTVDDLGLDERSDAEPSPSIASVVLGGVLTVVSVVVLLECWSMPGEATDPAGPKLFALVVTGVWATSCLLYLVGQVLGLVRGRRSGGKRGAASADRSRLLVQLPLTLLVLVAYAYAIQPVGYLLSTFVLGVALAVLMGGRHYLRDALAMAGLTLAIYLLFDQMIGINLPQGVLGL